MTKGSTSSSANAAPNGKEAGKTMLGTQAPLQPIVEEVVSGLGAQSQGAKGHQASETLLSLAKKAAAAVPTKKRQNKKKRKRSCSKTVASTSGDLRDTVLSKRRLHPGEGRQTTAVSSDTLVLEEVAYLRRRMQDQENQIRLLQSAQRSQEREGDRRREPSPRNPRQDREVLHDKRRVSRSPRRKDERRTTHSGRNPREEKKMTRRGPDRSSSRADSSTSRQGREQRRRSPERRRERSWERYVEHEDLKHLISREVRGQMRTSAPRSPRSLARSALGVCGCSPFTSEIEETEPPRRYSVRPDLKSYNGNTDPVLHIIHYEQMMSLFRSHDALMCKVFPTCLEGPALTWFSKLGEKSIHSWKQLAELFTARFIASTRPVRTITDLLSMRRGKEESLRDYSRRFFELMNEIGDCPPSVAAGTFKIGLPLESELFRELVKRPPTTLNELVSTVNDHVRLEQELGERGRAFGNFSGRDTTDRPRDKEKTQQRDPPKQNNYGSSKSNSGAKRGQPPYIAVNTIFNEPLEDILDAIKKEDFFRWPAKLQEKPGANKRFHCRYHKIHGHSTGRCFNLKCHLEELAQAGHLKKFLSSEQPPGKEDVRTEEDGGEALTMIEVIHGSADDEQFTEEGIQAQMQAVRRICHIRTDGSSGSAPKRQRDGQLKTEPALEFTDRDLNGVSLPHRDGLVVTLQIGEKHLVKRVFIDPGAEAEIMYLPLFRRLKLKESQLTPVRGRLVGFNGELSLPMGKIALPVLTEGVSVLTDFLVLDAPSPHNCILGRGWIHNMKAVPSTYHQVVKFPTPKGIKELRGDQVLSRRCSIAGNTGGSMEPAKERKSSGQDKGKAKVQHEKEAGTVASVEVRAAK